MSVARRARTYPKDSRVEAPRHPRRRVAPCCAGGPRPRGAQGIPAGLAARGPAGRGHRRGLSGAAGHGVRQCRGTAARRGSVGHPARHRAVRPAGLVPAAVGGARVDDGADDRDRRRAARRRRPRALRGAGLGARGRGGPDVSRGVGRPAGVRGRSALPARAHRVSGGRGTDHDGGSAHQTHRCPDGRFGVLPETGVLLRQPGPGASHHGDLQCRDAGLPLPGHAFPLEHPGAAAGARPRHRRGRGVRPAGPRPRCDRGDPGRAAQPAAARSGQPAPTAAARRRCPAGGLHRLHPDRARLHDRRRRYGAGREPGAAGPGRREPRQQAPSRGSR